jgi:hypothetical protein
VKDYPASRKAVLCPAERVIGLYNQNTGDTAARIAKKVRIWFRATARDNGWAGAHFLPEVQSNHGAGCVLWRQSDKVNKTVVVTEDMLILRGGRRV